MAVEVEVRTRSGESGPRSAPTRRLGGRARGDGGAALVEAGLLTPVLFFLLLGTLDGGLLLLDYSTVGSITRTANRTAAVAGNDGKADYFILQSAKGASAALRTGQIERIVIYKGSGSTSTVPSSCTSGSVTGVCNAYTEADLSLPETSTAFGCLPSSKDRYWCPTDRKVAQSGPEGPPDWIGIYVRVRHDYTTQLFGSDVDLIGDSVLRIEARSLT